MVVQHLADVVPLGGISWHGGGPVVSIPGSSRHSVEWLAVAAHAGRRANAAGIWPVQYQPENPAAGGGQPDPVAGAGIYRGHCLFPVGGKHEPVTATG
ncbi:hypothetical protein D3C77_677480 [compost metagenome]